MLAESLLLAAARRHRRAGPRRRACCACSRRTCPQDLPRLAGVALIRTVACVFAARSRWPPGCCSASSRRCSWRAARRCRRCATGTRVSGRTGPCATGLVASQLALALMLLVGAGLLARSFAALLRRAARVRHRPPPDLRRVGAGGDVSRPAPSAPAFFERAAPRSSGCPACRAVTLTTTLPVAGRGNGAWFNMRRSAVAGRPDAARRAQPRRARELLRRRWAFRSVAGRAFTPDDGARGHAGGRRQRVARAPLLCRTSIRSASGSTWAPPDNRVVPDSEIVGVVADVKQLGLDEERRKRCTRRMRWCRSSRGFTFAIRHRRRPAALAPPCASSCAGSIPACR